MLWLPACERVGAGLRVRRATGFCVAGERSIADFTASRVLRSFSDRSAAPRPASGDQRIRSPERSAGRPMDPASRTAVRSRALRPRSGRRRPSGRIRASGTDAVPVSMMRTVGLRERSSVVAMPSPMRAPTLSLLNGVRAVAEIRRCPTTAAAPDACSNCSMLKPLMRRRAVSVAVPTSDASARRTSAGGFQRQVEIAASVSLPTPNSSWR